VCVGAEQAPRRRPEQHGPGRHDGYRRLAADQRRRRGQQPHDAREGAAGGERLSLGVAEGALVRSRAGLLRSVPEWWLGAIQEQVGGGEFDGVARLPVDPMGRARPAVHHQQRVLDGLRTALPASFAASMRRMPWFECRKLDSDFGMVLGTRAPRIPAMLFTCVFPVSDHIPIQVKQRLSFT
jgi:hypothetical protein